MSLEDWILELNSRVPRRWTHHDAHVYHATVRGECIYMSASVDCIICSDDVFSSRVVS